MPQSKSVHSPINASATRKIHIDIDCHLIIWPLDIEGSQDRRVIKVNFIT